MVEKKQNPELSSPNTKSKSNTNFESFINNNKRIQIDIDKKFQKNKNTSTGRRNYPRNHSFQEKNINLEFTIKRNTTIASIKYQNPSKNTSSLFKNGKVDRKIIKK